MENNELDFYYNSDETKNFSPQFVANFLNDLYKIDPVAIIKLLKNKVPCNDQLALHPTVQCSVDELTGETLVGIVGVINGIVNKIDEDSWIATQWDEENNFCGFCVIHSDDFVKEEK